MVYRGPDSATEAVTPSLPGTGEVEGDSGWVPEIRNSDVGRSPVSEKDGTQTTSAPSLHSELSAHIFHSWLDRIF